MKNASNYLFNQLKQRRINFVTDLTTISREDDDVYGLLLLYECAATLTDADIQFTTDFLNFASPNNCN